MLYTKRKTLAVLLLALTLFAAIATVSWSHNSTVHAAQSLRDLAQARGIAFGAAVSTDPLQNDSNYRTILDREFNMVVPENALKFDATEPNQQGVFDFSGADSIINHAQQNNMQVRGHTLVWGQQLPGWLTGGNFNRDQLISILRNHITTVVQRYSGKIQAWDVVNEAFIDPCCESTSDANGLRKNFWYNGIGADYIDLAFQMAHDADPNVALYLNEYGAEGSGTKSDYVYNYVQGMRNRGIPINGVGMQTHLQGYGNPAPSQQELQTNMTRLGNLGLKVQVTELDVQIYYTQGSYDQKLQQQAQVYADVTNACLSVSACNAILTWGVDDNHSWLPSYTGHSDEAGLLFDRSYQAKPAYYAVANALGASSSGGSSQTLNPVADRYNHESCTGTEYIVHASVWQTSYFKFNLSGVSGNVSRATLRLYHERWNDQGNLVVTAHKASDGWSETDNNSLPGFGDQISSTTISGTGWLELDVTSYVSAEKSGDGVVTIAVRAQNDIWAPFHSRENGSNKPELVVSSN